MKDKYVNQTETSTYAYTEALQGITNVMTGLKIMSFKPDSYLDKKLRKDQNDNRQCHTQTNAQTHACAHAHTFKNI